MRTLLIPCAFLGASLLPAQEITNIGISDSAALHVLRGQYDPSTYAAGTVIDDHHQIICELRTLISADSLQAHIERLVSFQTRHTFSDTASTTTGIGAARRWAFQRFQAYSDANNGRLIPAYLRFDYADDVCDTAQDLRNVLAVLPGRDTSNKSIVLIEAHLDSRCEDNCDPTCLAQGADDNASGSALVLELARVLGRYTFDHTIVLMLTVGEEQGLVGATAMSTFCVEEGIAIKGVQNNDIVGGIWCGTTSSEPGCPAEGDVDSLHVRLFSNGSITRTYRGFARTIKMYYEEKLRSQVPVPMDIEIMNVEDRTDRGGDHIPFRMDDFRNVRFTSANEHGNANVEDSTYHDRQHTSNDVLGVDTDGDLVVDSFFVDFNYLQRNTMMNGLTATMLALGPEPPAFIVHDEPTGLRVSFTPAPGDLAYRIGVRAGNTNPDFTTVYRTADTSFLIPGLSAGVLYYISAATIDQSGIMSPFTREYGKSNDANTPPALVDDLPYGINCASIGLPELHPPGTSGVMLLASPNPFQRSTEIRISNVAVEHLRHGVVVISDMMGREVARVPIERSGDDGRVTYVHRGASGMLMARYVGNGRSGAAILLMANE
jgi:hypothetical protein